MKLDNPSNVNVPCFLMNYPFSVSNKVINNAWMSSSQGDYDKQRAGDQWLKLYHYLAERGLVYILPGHNDLQDLPFVANLGCYLPHIKDKDVILLSKFTSKPRRGEEMFGRKFFRSFDYRAVSLPYCWEGEADLKWVRDNVYVGGIGSRSTVAAFAWMEDQFDMLVTTIELTDPKLYHLDCVYFPLDSEKALVNVAAIKPADLRKLEALTEIVEVPAEYVYEGWTNVVRVGNTILYAPGEMRWLKFERLLEKHSLLFKMFDLSEFNKSGADLSCLVCHLNYLNRP